MFRSLTSALRGAPTATKAAAHSLTPPSALFPATNLNALSVFPKHTIPFISTKPEELIAWHQHARDTGYLDRPDHWAVIDALGIPSAGVGLKLAFLSSKELVDQGIPQITIQLLPFAPVVFTNLPDGGVLSTHLLAPDSLQLTDPEHTPFVLARSNNGTDFVGGVYMRLFKDRQALVKAHSTSKEAATSEQGGFMRELGQLVAKRFFAPKK